jgi:hypothetical protein
VTPTKIALFLLLQIIWGCGGGGRGSGVVNGSFSGKGISGQTMAVQDAMYASRVVGVNLYDQYTSIVLVNKGGICSMAAIGTPKNLQLISITLHATLDSGGFSTPASAPGTYQVFDDSGPVPPGDNLAVVHYGSGDASCARTLEQSAFTGTVTVNAISGDAISGTFDVTFPGQNHVTGSFNAPSCAALANPSSGSDACI